MSPTKATYILGMIHFFFNYKAGDKNIQETINPNNSANIARTNKKSKRTLFFDFKRRILSKLF